MSRQPIGLFDSGLGGLTVLRELKRLLPHENAIYLGDTGRLPYGNRSKEAILRFSLENSSFLIEQGIKLLIVACHTASSIALQTLQDTLPIPVLGVVAPGVFRVLQTTQTNEIAILGTASTIASGAHALQIKALRADVCVHPIACPLFVPLVEEGFADHVTAEMIAHHYLDPLQKHPIDTVLLACTHYPLLERILKNVLGPNISLVEPAAACIEEVRSFLASRKLLTDQTHNGSYLFYSTESPDKFQRHASLFFGSKIESVKLKLLSS